MTDREKESFKQKPWNNGRRKKKTSADMKRFERRGERSKYGFVRLYYPFLFDARVDPYVLKVYLGLKAWALGDARCYPSHALMSERLSIGLTKLKKCLKTLERLGWIEVTPLSGRVNFYWILNPDELYSDEDLIEAAKYLRRKPRTKLDELYPIPERIPTMSPDDDRDRSVGDELQPSHDVSEVDKRTLDKSSSDQCEESSPISEDVTNILGRPEFRH